MAPLALRREDARVVLELGSRDLEESEALADAFPRATVHAFECNPDAIARCKAGWASLRNRDRIRPQYVAIHETDGEADFFPIDASRHANIGASSLTRSIEPRAPEHGYFRAEPIRVPCTRLDTWCAASGIGRIDYIWSDLQGYDLRGLLTLGERLRTVSEIHMEVELIPLFEINSMLADAIGTLARFGFRPARFVAEPNLTWGDCDFIRAG